MDELAIAGPAADALASLTPAQVTFLRSVEKAELHAHLNGSIPIGTLKELAREYAKRYALYFFTCWADSQVFPAMTSTLAVKSQQAFRNSLKVSSWRRLKISSRCLGRSTPLHLHLFR